MDAPDLIETRLRVATWNVWWRFGGNWRDRERAIVVLLLFGLMLTRAPIGREALDNQQRGLALLVSLGVLIGLIFLIQLAFGDQHIELAPTRTAEVGESLFFNFVMPFEVVSFLLLAALIGAIVLARREEP
jgi:NADH-quinone oxidoreductase subunit J